jgi:type II secretory pathway component PulC
VKKEQKQLMVIGVGLPIMVFFLWMNLKPAAKRPPVSDVPEAASVDASANAAAPVVSVNPRVHGKVSALQLKRQDVPWGRDPFWSGSDSTGKLNEFTLKGISFSQNKKGYAFINDQIVSAGDALGGYEVSRIEKDRVMLTRGSQTFFLTFSENK